MDTISKICRLCLTSARRTYSVNDTTLLTVWERLTNSKFDNIGGGTFVVCYICCAQLRRCHELEQRAVEAEMLFKKYVIDNHFEESKPLVSLIVSKADEIDYNYAIEHQYNYEFKCGGTNALEEVKEDNIYVKEEVKVELTDCSEESITAREPLYIEVKEHNISVKEEVKDELIEENITIAEDLEVGESSIKEDLDNLIGNCNNVFIENKAIPSEITNEKGLFEQCLPECTTKNAPSDSNSEANQSNISNVNGSRKKFSCDICHYECSLKSTWNIHRRLHTADNLFKCDLCDYSCIMKTQLNRHMQSKHINENRYSCQICEKKFVDNGNLNKHLRIHTGDKPFKCDLCDYRCSLKGNLESHVLCKHIKDRKYSCHICEKKFVVNSSLKRHFRIHTGDKPYKCDLCDYRCSRKGDLNNHMRYKHTKDKNFSCHLCEMKFVVNGDLKRHLRIHTSDKPYKCDLCDYRCSRKGDLNNHMRYKHTKDKNFSCHLCEMKFVVKGDLKKHLRIHNGEKPYKCDLCDYRCSRKGDLNNHMQYKHIKEKNFSCTLCEMKFVVKGDLNKHLRRHTRSKGLHQDP